jgi:hypothetical protein
VFRPSFASQHCAITRESVTVPLKDLVQTLFPDRLQLMYILSADRDATLLQRTAAFLRTFRIIDLEILENIIDLQKLNKLDSVGSYVSTVSVGRNGC